MSAAARDSTVAVAESTATPQAPPVRVLYSFPHKIGAGRICTTAWYQVSGLAQAGAEVVLWPGAVARPLPAGIEVRPTLARGRTRVPYRLIGQRRALTVHDWIVARRLPALVGSVDLVHVWPSGALQTLKVARSLGIPTVLERPNAHTRYAYDVVRRECDRLGIDLPAGHEHAYNAAILQREEEEYRHADYLLCPSDFVARTFVDAGFPDGRLLRHAYGFDEAVFYPPSERRAAGQPFTALFVGVAAVRKGLHYALEAWLRSPASSDGRFLIAGAILPAYREKLAAALAHPSVVALGHREDVAELMRRSDVLVLPSIEEGSALVCVEALGTGCVPLVSDACTDACHHGENALVHRVGDVDALTEHLTLLHEDRGALEALRERGLATASRATWSAAGRRLLEVYGQVLGSRAVPQPASYAPESGAAPR